MRSKPTEVENLHPSLIFIDLLKFEDNETTDLIIMFNKDLL